MLTYDTVIVGGGPAGLSAAERLLESGAKVCLIDRNTSLGGQLVKQTHKFFGSEKEHASKRGIDIMALLTEKISRHGQALDILTGTTVVALYSDKVLGCLRGETYFKVRAKTIIIATGASEKSLPFENNDLPGIYAAGAVQTLMNEYGVRPGSKVLMVGSGNIGLIVSYQLIQAGVEVAAVVEAADHISGYLVHASKIRRLKVPILTRTSIKRAEGGDRVDKVIIWDLDKDWNGIEGSERVMELDTVCISVGLAPLTELLMQAGAKVSYVRELGGNVPDLSDTYETSLEGVYACGDVSGIEEASSAMVEGRITGMHVSRALNKDKPGDPDLISDLQDELSRLRSGPHAAKVRAGYQKAVKP